MGAHKGSKRTVEGEIERQISLFANKVRDFYVEENETRDMVLDRDPHALGRLAVTGKVIGRVAVRILRAHLNGNPVVLHDADMPYVEQAYRFIGYQFCFDKFTRMAIARVIVESTGASYDKANEWASAVCREVNAQTAILQFNDQIRQDYLARLERHAAEIGNSFRFKFAKAE